MDITGLVSLLVTLLVLGLVFYVVMWAIRTIGVPEPFNKVILAIVVIIFVLLLLGLLFGGISMPRPVFWHR